MNSIADRASFEHSHLAHSSTLIWAIICSILLHITLAYIIPTISFERPKKPETIELELVKKELPPAPVPMVTPPEPVKAEPLPKPIKKIKLPPMMPVAEESPEPNVTPPPTPTPQITQTEVIAVPPKPEAPPNPAPPAPVVAPPPSGPSQAEMDDARSRYGSALWGALEKHKQYPRIAQMRGWQGEVILELLLDGNGKLKSKKVISSSGHEALDKQALDMVEKASPFPTPPEALRGNQFSIRVPIPFRLEG